MKVTKYNLNPTNEQRTTLLNWIKGNIVVYNACVEKWNRDRKQLKNLVTTMKKNVSSYKPEVQSIDSENDVIQSIKQKISNDYRDMQHPKLRCLMHTLDNQSETKSELANYANALTYYVAREKKQTEGAMKEGIEEYLKAEQKQQTSGRGQRFRNKFLKKIITKFDDGVQWAASLKNQLEAKAAKMKNFLGIESLEIKSLMYAFDQKDKLSDGPLKNYANGLIKHVKKKQKWKTDDIKEFKKNATNGFYPVLDVERAKAYRKAFSNEGATLLKSNRGIKNKLKDMPSTVRNSPISDFQDAISAQLVKLKRGRIKSFMMKPRSVTNRRHCIRVGKAEWNRATKWKKQQDTGESLHAKAIDSKYREIWGSGVLKISEKGKESDIGTLEHDAKLLYTRPGKYELCVCSEVTCATEPPPKHLASMDPGVRDFQTVWDLEGFMIDYGSNVANKLFNLSQKKIAIEFKSRQKGVRHQQRYRMKKRARKIQRKIENIRNDMHRNLAKYLCENFKHVLIPKFNVSAMVKKENRNISKKTARQMQLLGHYQFRQRLIAKARETGTKVEVVTEEYTTKTCGSCGNIHAKIGSNKTFKCPNVECKAEYDRDFNAARNIFIKFLSDE